MTLQSVVPSECKETCKNFLMTGESIDVYREKFNSYWRHHDKSKATVDISKIEQYLRGVPCGLMSLDPTTSIPDAKTIPNSAWPWHVLLCKYRFCCWGTLISQEMVVTAARCLHVSEIARTGVNNRSDSNRAHEQVRLVLNYTGHKDFNNVVGNDVALLHLDRRVNITGDSMRPVRLPYVDIQDMDNCYLTGESKDRNKRQMRVKLVPLNICRMICRTMEFHIDERSLCFVGVNQNDSACKGDYGGRVHCFHNGKWHLVGVASQTITGCDPRFPTIYVAVHWFIEWILEEALTLIDPELLF